MIIALYGYAYLAGSGTILKPVVVWFYHTLGNFVHCGFLYPAHCTSTCSTEISCEVKSIIIANVYCKACPELHALKKQ